MFKDMLHDLVERTDGSIGGLIMGFDGIPVEQYLREGRGLDIETVGMEYSVILDQIRKAATSLDAGSAQEISIKADKLTTVMRLINEEYFVALALGPGGNTGKGRYLLRTVTPKLLDELS